MTLQLFVSFPPLREVEISTRELVAGGHLIQRELVDVMTFGGMARKRSLPAPDLEQLERWDREGVFSPLAFAVADGPLVGWRTTDPYPVEGIRFRDEHPYVPWAELTSKVWDESAPRPLYSPWQLLYLDAAREFEGVEVFTDAMLKGGEDLTTWAEGHRPFVEQHVGWRSQWHDLWLPTIQLLVRLQSRHWPFVEGRSVMLIDSETHEYVDALELEHERSTPESTRTELGITNEQVVSMYEWFARRWEGLDPVSDLYPLLRLEPRRRRTRRSGIALRALDFQDAAGMLRRFARDLLGVLPPDLDQLDQPDVEPRPVRRDRGQLQQALRQAGLYPHKLHMVVEGATEERLIRRLVLAFSGPWEGSGLAITDLGGDKLEGSRLMLEGFAVYADAVALLLDDENDARRVTEQLARSGVVVGEHVKLWDKSLEEDNFSPAELLGMVAELGRASGTELRLTEDQLMAEQASVEARPGRRKALASTLQRLAREPEHGSVVYNKPDLAEPMAALILEEIDAAPGRHAEVSKRRPIVEWMLAYPIRATQS